MRSGLEGVFLENRAVLLRFLRARGAGEDAEDLLQEIWFKAAAGASGPLADPLAYLFRVANNLLLDRRRADLRRSRRDQSWTEYNPAAEGEASTAASQEHVLLTREELGRVQSTLDGLGERTAAIFRRFRIDGVGQREIAADEGISVSAVEKHIQRAYRALAEVRSAPDAE